MHCGPCWRAWRWAPRRPAPPYPERPVRLIAPIAVGGLTDTLARLVASGLADKLGQPVVVENKPGAGGIIGMEAAAQAAPDGYTLILVYQGVAAVNASLYKNLPYDTRRDFAPVASWAISRWCWSPAPPPASSRSGHCSSAPASRPRRPAMRRPATRPPRT